MAAVAGVLVSGCGTRLDRDEVQAASGTTVTLSPESIEALRGGLGATESPRPVVERGRSVDQRPGDRVKAAAPTNTAAAASATVRTRTRSVVAAIEPTAGPARPGRIGCSGAGEPVTIGQIGTFSGVVGPISAGMRETLAVWAKEMNARGGLACHPVRVITGDDGGEPARAAALGQDMVAKHVVIAFVGNYALFSVGGLRSMVERLKVPAVGGDLLSAAWHESQWMFPQGASLYPQLVGLYRHGVSAGYRRIGLLYCVEVEGCRYVAKHTREAAADAGGETLYDAPVSVTQTDYTAQCLNAKNAGVDQLALGMDGGSMIRVARSCASIGYRPVFSSGGGNASPAQTRDPLLRELGLISETPVAPWFLRDTPALRAYRDAMDRYAPNVEPTGNGLLAWVSGKLLEAAVARVPDGARTGRLSVEVLVDGLSRIRGETLGGLTGPLSFGPGQREKAGGGCVFFERLGPAGWTAPRGSRPVCR